MGVRSLLVTGTAPCRPPPRPPLPPLQGYVFPELAKITHADIASCDKMAEWLVDKLKRSPDPPGEAQALARATQRSTGRSDSCCCCACCGWEWEAHCTGV